MTDIENDPSELILKMTDVVPGDEFEFIKIQPDGSRKPYKVRVQLLRSEEDRQILEDAQKYAKKYGENPREYTELYRQGQALHAAITCLRSPKKRERDDGTHYYPPLFLSVEQIRASFTESEIAQVLNMLEIVKAKYNALAHYSDEEFERWVEAIGDKLTGSFFLQGLDCAHWPNLILRLSSELLEAWIREGYQPRSLRATSESGQTSSDGGTGSFSELPAAHSVDTGATLPTDKLLTKDEARELGKKLYGPKKKK